MFSLTTVISRSFGSASGLFTPRRAQSAPYGEQEYPGRGGPVPWACRRRQRYISSQVRKGIEAVFGHHAPVLQIQVL